MGLEQIATSPLFYSHFANQQYKEVITISAQEKANIYTLTTPDGTEQILPRTVVEAVTGALPTSGGTMTGNINMGGKKITNTTHVAGPSVTINGAGNTYIVTGSTANIVGYTSGDISVVDHTIRMVKDPVAPQDAANKRYIDSKIGSGTAFPVISERLMNLNTAKTRGVYSLWQYPPNGVGIPPDLPTGGAPFYGTLIVTDNGDGQFWQQLQTDKDNKIRLRYGNPNALGEWATIGASGTGFPVIDTELYNLNTAQLNGVYYMLEYPPNGVGIPPDLPTGGTPFMGTLIVTGNSYGYFWQQLQTNKDDKIRIRRGTPNGLEAWTTISGTGDFKSDGSVPMTGDLNFNSKEITNIQGIHASNGLYVNFWDTLGFEISQYGRTLMQWNDKAITLESQTRIENVANPVNPQDVANKEYVDSHSGGGTGDFKADGSIPMTGTLVSEDGQIILRGTTDKGIFFESANITFNQDNTGVKKLVLGDLDGGIRSLTLSNTKASINGNLTTWNPQDPQDVTTKTYVDGFFETYKSKVDAPSSGVPTRMRATSNNMYYWRDSFDVVHICGNIVYDSELQTSFEAFRIPEIFVNASLEATYYPAIVSMGLLACVVRIFTDGRVFLDTVEHPFGSQRTLHLDISYPLYT